MPIRQAPSASIGTWKPTSEIEGILVAFDLRRYSSTTQRVAGVPQPNRCIGTARPIACRRTPSTSRKTVVACDRAVQDRCGIGGPSPSRNASGRRQSMRRLFGVPPSGGSGNQRSSSRPDRVKAEFIFLKSDRSWAAHSLRSVWKVLGRVAPFAVPTLGRSASFAEGWRRRCECGP